MLLKLMISGRKSMLSNWSCLNWSIAEQTARGGSTVGLCRCVCAQLCLYEPTDCSLPGSSVHGIPQARILEWVAISVFRGSSWPRDPTHVSCISFITGGLFTRWATGTNDVIFQQTVGLEDTWLSLLILQGLSSSGTTTWQYSPGCPPCPKGLHPHG